MPTPTMSQETFAVSATTQIKQEGQPGVITFVEAFEKKKEQGDPVRLIRITNLFGRKGDRKRVSITVSSNPADIKRFLDALMAAVDDISEKEEALQAEAGLMEQVRSFSSEREPSMGHLAI